MIRIANSANGSLDENSFFKDSALKRQAILIAGSKPLLAYIVEEYTGKSSPFKSSKRLEAWANSSSQKLVKHFDDWLPK